MRFVLDDPDLVVVDDFLSPSDASAVTTEVDRAPYHSVHARGWDRAWRLWDGEPLRGAPVYYDPGFRFPDAATRYPTGSSIDAFLDGVRTLTAARPDVVGRERAAWSAAFLSPWLYPVGSALSWHVDGGGYSGAFTYFAHPHWEMTWGGELFVLESGSGVVRTPDASTAWPTDRADADVETSSGIATCVFPRPNRMVLLGPGRAHMIRRVDSAAGAHARAGLAGFFLRT